MKRYSIIIGGVIVAVLVIIIIANGYKFNAQPQRETAVPDPIPASIKDTTYVVEHQAVTLVNGLSVMPIEGSATKVTTKYFGNEVAGDFNNDGRADTAFLLTQDTGGSGTFYYLVVALKTSTGYQGTNGILLGDRIAPQTTGYLNGLIVVNYADRGPKEPMTTIPTVGVSRYFRVDGSALVEAQP
jgi:hypothetical protein